MGWSMAVGVCTAFTASAFAADLENYLVKPQYYDIFYGRDHVQHLTGVWKFKPVVNVLVKKGNGIYPAESTADPGTDEGLTAGYFREDFTDADWSDVPVPWRWNESFDTQPGEPYAPIPFAGVGYFRKTFTLTEPFAGRRVVLHFDSVQTACRVWVNGVEVGSHVNSDRTSGPMWGFNDRLWLEDFEFDVTDQLKPEGPNVVALRVYDDGQPIQWNRFIDGGGIGGPVTLEFREPVFSPEILVAPNIDTGEVALDVGLCNQEKAPRAVNLRVEVEPFTSEFYTPPCPAPGASADLGRVECPAGDSRRSFSLTIPEHKLWDVNQPFLYHLRLLADGKLIGQTRFGFRKFEVRGNQFFLNGSPLRVLGNNIQSGWDYRGPVYYFNKGNGLRLGVQLLKNVNLNFSRVHNGPATQIFYDICDEIGLLLQDDFSPRYAALKPEEITRAEMIAQAYIGNYVDADGRLNQDFQCELRKWLGRNHNHPAICSFTGGNELGHTFNRNNASQGQMAAYIDGFYDFVKAHDLQHRPVTSSSGLAIWDWQEPVKSDFLDHHTYVDGDTGWADCATGNHKCIGDWERIFGKSIAEINQPVIVGECGGYQTDRDFGRKEIRDLFTDGRLDKSKYVEYCNRMAAEQGKSVGYWQWTAQCWHIRWAGIRSLATLADTEQATARLTADLTYVLRRDMDFYQGFHLQAIGPDDFGFDFKKLGADEAELQRMFKAAQQHVEFTDLQRALAPRMVCLDMYDRHGFAGETFRTGLYVINDYSGDDGRGFTAKLGLEAQDGRTLVETDCAFDIVPPAGNAHQPVTLPLAAELASGQYRLRARLFKTGQLVNEQEYPLLIQRRADLPKVSTTRRVALYDTSETLFRGLGAAASRLVLEDLDLAYTPVNDLSDLTGCDVLIIGANSFDQNLQNQSEALRAWLEKGGRIVCFEQVYAGPVPFLSEMRLHYCGNMFKADPIELEHPVLRATDAWQWELWNGRREKIDGALDAAGKRIYDTYLLPMTEGVVTAGGPRGGGWTRNLVFGMVAAEARVGTGLAFFSQALATQRYGLDPVPTRYLRDVLAYTLGDDWDGRYAAAVTGKRVTFYDRNTCFFVDLRPQANRGFADDVDGDQKGGWTDQGKNDLRRIPRGDVTFGGVPYQILDDAAGSPTCVVLAGGPRPYFPAECRGIKVGRTARQLAFLHAVAWGKSAEPVGSYLIHYADGSTEEIKLVLGEQIGGWWSPADLANTPVAWAAVNPTGVMAGLYTYLWMNPYPDKAIATIDFISAQGSSVPVLAAITGMIK